MTKERKKTHTATVVLLFVWFFCPV